MHNLSCLQFVALHKHHLELLTQITIFARKTLVADEIYTSYRTKARYDKQKYTLEPRILLFVSHSNF